MTTSDAYWGDWPDDVVLIHGSVFTDFWQQTHPAGEYADPCPAGAD